MIIELTRLRDEIKFWRNSYNLLIAEKESIELRLLQEITINDLYREFFKTKPEYCNWIRDHDAQFQAFKNSPYYVAPSVLRERKLSTGKKSKRV